MTYTNADTCEWQDPVETNVLVMVMVSSKYVCICMLAKLLPPSGPRAPKLSHILSLEFALSRLSHRSPNPYAIPIPATHTKTPGPSRLPKKN